MLPYEFKKLERFKVRHKHRPHDSEYSYDVPSVGSSSNSVWNDGAQFAEQYQTKSGRVKEHFRDEFDVALVSNHMQNLQSASDLESRHKENRHFGLESSVQTTNQRHSNGLRNENMDTEGNSYSVTLPFKAEHPENKPNEKQLQDDCLKRNANQMPSCFSSNRLDNLDVGTRKRNGRSIMSSGTPAAQTIFSESDFPPLSSSDSECGATPPRPSSQLFSGKQETVGSPLTLPVYRNAKVPPHVVKAQKSFAGVEYSGSLGRGRGRNLLSNMAQPRARLPAEDKPVDFRTLKMRGVKFNFPEDEELLASSEVVQVSDARNITGTRVRIRET